MAYSKRWELIHLLGGKCVDCNNENFYDLEIDHIFNDGDGERKYYTLTEKNYLDNPIKAKKRLAVRCKKCHEERHHPIIISEIQNAKKLRMQLFMNVLKGLEGDNQTSVEEKILIQELEKSEKFTQDEARNYIRLMLREASIYESKPGHYNQV